jgi:DNA-binding CsgD family transcriptional regulator
MSKTRGRPRIQDQLTPAEWKIVNAVRHGLSNPAIAKRMAVSLDAVKYHVSNAMQKLGFVRRMQLQQWDGVAQQSALSENKKAAVESLNKSRKRTMPQAEMSAIPTAPMHTDQLGVIAQISRVVLNIDQARSWYSDVAGLRHIYSFGKMAFFDCAGMRLMLSEAERNPKSKRAKSLSSNESILYFRVVDIHDAQNALVARGAVFVSAPHLVHRHSDGTEEWMAFFQDNEARPLALVAQIKPKTEVSST